MDCRFPSEKAVYVHMNIYIYIYSLVESISVSFSLPFSTADFLAGCLIFSF